MDAKNEVDIKDGPVNVDQLAAYDMKGNLIQGSGSVGIGAGGMRVSMDKDKLSIKYNMGAGLTVHATGSRNKKPIPEAQKLLKEAQELDKQGILTEQIKMMKNQMKRGNMPNQHYNRGGFRRR